MIYHISTASNCFRKYFGAPELNFINTGLQPGGTAGSEVKAVLTASRTGGKPLKRFQIRRT
jgi:hypothetical protein